MSKHERRFFYLEHRKWFLKNIFAEKINGFKHLLLRPVIGQDTVELELWLQAAVGIGFVLVLHLPIATVPSAPAQHVHASPLPFFHCTVKSTYYTLFTYLKRLLNGL